MSKIVKMPRSFPDEEYDAALVLCLLRYTDRLHYQSTEDGAHKLIIQFDSITNSTLQIVTLCVQAETCIAELKKEAAILLGLDMRHVPLLVMQYEGIPCDLHNHTKLSSLPLHGITMMRMSIAHDR